MVSDSKTAIIATVCIIISACVSGIFVYLRLRPVSSRVLLSNSLPIASVTPAIITTSISSLNPTEMSADTDLKEAMRTLENFNNYLAGGEYAKAAELFDWEMGDLQQIFGKYYAIGDHVKTLANVCKDPNYCLRFYKILKTKKNSSDEYQFTIQYQTKDNKIFVNSAHVSGSFVNNTDFLYRVKKKNGNFKVEEPPNFFTVEAE